MLTHRATMTAHKNTTLSAALLLGLLLVSALAGCSHAGSTAAGTVNGGNAAAVSSSPSRTKGSVTEPSAAFCSFLAAVNAISAKATSQQQGLQLLGTLIPKLQAQRAAAPPTVAADFGVIATAARQATAQGNLAPLATNQVAAAGTSLTAYCHSRN